MSSPDSDPDLPKFEGLAARLADGEDPDWAEELRVAADPRDQEVIAALKVIGDVARASRLSQSRDDGSSEASLPGLPEQGIDTSGPTLQPGQRLGPYTVIGRIGSGGMGEVYRARQTQLGRDVAIKTLPWRCQISPEARRRFAREGRLSAALAHRNVVAVHDFCEHDGIAFVVEELLDGRPWRAVIRDNPGATPKGALRMIGEAASGVAAAHASGLIHRDLKPENLFETVGGETKVLDFGLARLLDPIPVSPFGGSLSSSVGLGTPAYLAPECLRGGVADQRSDVFALACSAYELLTGANPFLRANTGDTVVALLKEAPEPLGGKLRGVPPHLAEAIERGLSKQPEVRPTAGEIAQAAFDAAKTGEADIRPLGRSQRHWPRRVTVAAAVGAVLIIAALSYPRLRPVPVAVIQFDGLAADEDLNYVAVAVSEQLNQRLAHRPGLTMVSRFLIGQRPAKDPRAAGRALGARRVVTGRLRETGAGFAADVEVLDVPSGRKVWGQTFEGSAAGLSGFEDRVVTAVAAALGTSATSTSRAAAPQSAEAHRLYLEGRYHWFRRTPNELYKAINLYTHALSLDPDYALAHAGLSRAYVDLTYYVPGVSSRQTRVVARRSAERALALDPNLVRGITALADVEAGDWNREVAHRLYQRAMELDSTDPDAYIGEAVDVLLPEGRFQEARELLRLGLGLDVSSLVREALGRISYYERDFDRASREFAEVLDSDPGFVSARYRLGQVLLAKGQPEKALVPLGEADKQTGGLAKGRAIIVYALASAGRRSEAEALLSDLLKEREKTYVSATLIAVAYTGMGLVDEAFAWLKRGCDEHAEWMALVGIEPLLDPLRKDPRFASILTCVGPQGR